MGGQKWAGEAGVGCVWGGAGMLPVLLPRQATRSRVSPSGKHAALLACVRIQLQKELLAAAGVPVVRPHHVPHAAQPPAVAVPAAREDAIVHALRRHGHGPTSTEASRWAQFVA